jgi:hypothetical protein
VRHTENGGKTEFILIAFVWAIVPATYTQRSQRKHFGYCDVFHWMGKELVYHSKGKNNVPVYDVKVKGGSRFTTQLIFHLGTGWGWPANFTLRLFYPQENIYLTKPYINIEQEITSRPT